MAFATLVRVRHGHFLRCRQGAIRHLEEVRRNVVNRRPALTSNRRPRLIVRRSDKLTILIEECLLNHGQSSAPVRPISWSSFNARSHLHLRQSSRPVDPTALPSHRPHLARYFTGCRLSYCAANPGTDNTAHASAPSARASVTPAIMFGGLNDEHSAC